MGLLTFSALKNDLYRMVGSKVNNGRSDIDAAVTSAIFRAGEEFVNYGNWGFLEQLTDRVYIPLAGPYSTGTITVTQDSKTVTGSGTTFTKDMEGSFLACENSEFYEIRSFASTTSLTLAIPYQGSSASGASYSIYKRFWPLPLNFLRPIAKDAKLSTPGSTSETPIAYNPDASFTDLIISGRPSYFGIIGNTRNSDYYNTGSVTIATSGGVSTWTFSGAALPTDIVDREIRVAGESRSYYISTRSSSSVLITYDTYVNPSDATNTLSTASSYAITPQSTQLVAFDNVPDDRYIFSLPYIKKLDEMLLDTDVSPIVYAGYSSAFLAMCRFKLAEDARVAMRGDQVKNLTDAKIESMANAWLSETQGEAMKWEGAIKQVARLQQGPSWISR